MICFAHAGQSEKKSLTLYLCTTGVQARAFSVSPLSCSLSTALSVLGTSFGLSCHTYTAMSLSHSTEGTVTLQSLISL